jgi:post-segregation antitoxin (ccd killing protein)
MSAQVITDGQLFETLHWLEENARPAAQARAHRVYLEEYLSHQRAKIAQECMDEGESAAKADIKAKASPAYLTTLTGLKAAIEEDEFFRWHRTHADAIVSAWQTLSANRRSIERGT